MERKITLLGGDRRNLQLAYLLSEDKNQILVHGFDQVEENPRLIKEKDIIKAVEYSNLIIGPVPFMEENGILNTPLFSEKINIKDIFEHLSEDHILMGGYILDKYIDLAENYPFKIIDYYKREEMQILNAIPTAEGAIQIAMGEMDTTIHGSNILVIGFGRVGKIIAKMLDGIGANVCVGARSNKDISWIKAYGYRPILLKELEKNVSYMDVIFTTIPKVVIDRTILKKISKKTLIVNSGSKPGGVDIEKAKEMNIKAISISGIPGLTSPRTGGLCIKETVYNIINELKI